MEKKSYAKYLTIFVVSSVLITAIGVSVWVLLGLSSTGIVSTKLTVDRPSLVKAGDLLIANIAVNGGSQETVNAPSGWTQIQRTDNDTNVSIISYWKIANSGEPNNYSWDITPYNNAKAGITHYSGIDKINPIDAVSGNTGLGTLATTSPIITTAANENVVALYAVDGGAKNGPSFSTTTGMDKQYDASSVPFGLSISGQDTIQQELGVVGVKFSSISVDKSKNWATQLISLRPALTHGLSGYWKFDETTGDASDSSGRGNTLTNINSTVFIGGKINNSAVIIATSSQYFAIPYNVQNGLNFSSAFSTSFWVKLTSLPGSNEYSVISKQDGTSQNFSYRIAIIGGGSSSANEIYALYSDNGAVTNDHLGEFDSPMNYFTSADVGVWVHIVVIVDAAHQTVTAYKNGIPTVLTKRGTINNARSIYSGPAPFAVGALNTVNTPIRFLDGQIDEMGIWSRVLTPYDVLRLFNNGNGLSFANF